LILITKDFEMHERAIDIAKNDKLPLDQVEREVFGADHAEVGTYLLWLWALPESVCEAVAFHHRPAESLAKGITPVALVHAADLLTHEISPDETDWPRLSQIDLESIGIADRFEEWRNIAREALAQQSSEGASSKR